MTGSQAQVHSQARIEHYHRLADFAKQALGSGDLTEAARTAKELLTLAHSLPRDWNYGNAIHDGHVVLGRVALAHDDVARAREHLRAAGVSPGSPQLMAFGPNLSLAAELLLLDERDVVCEYLRGVRTFWAGDAERVDDWLAEIALGLIPDFGPNLVY